MKSGSLNLLEPSGPHRACYGTPLQQPNEGETREGILPLVLANSQDGVKLQEQDYSHQFLSCTTCFGIASWLRKEPEKVEQRMIKLLTVEGIHQPKACLNRLYIKRQNGGCGIVELESAHNAAIFGLSEYIKQGKDRLTRLVNDYGAVKAKYCQ